MIEANKKLIKATLTQGVVGIQNSLVTLYQTNLSAMATQAALIAGFAFSAVQTTSSFNPAVNDDSGNINTIAYFTYTLFTICLVAALFVLSQATVVVMFGPAMALKGAEQLSVKNASELMRDEQWKIFKIGAVSITALFVGSLILCWANYPRNIAAIVTCVYVIGYILLIMEGRRAYLVFSPKDDVTLNNTSGNAKDGEGNAVAAARALALEKANEKKRTKLKGVIWLRDAPERGGLFVRCFGILKNGKLDFYKSENDYLGHNNPILSQPINIWLMTLETDPKKFQKDVTSISNVMKASMMGENTKDFSLTDLMASSFDLPFAAKHYRFALVPKVSSELVAMNTFEMLGHDEGVYNDWVTALRTSIEGFDEIEALPTVEGTMKAGIDDVEAVVRAANY